MIHQRLNTISGYVFEDETTVLGLDTGLLILLLTLDENKLL